MHHLNLQTFLQGKPIIGHRGLCTYAPENTLAALSAAHHHGIHAVEFDVYIAKCGTPVVLHDSNLLRTTGHDALVSEMTYKEIEKLDAGSWFNSTFKDEKIPSLAEWLTLAAHLNIAVNIEIKSPADRLNETVANTLSCIEAHWPASHPKPLLSSFDIPVIAKVREAGPQWAIGYEFTKWKRLDLKYAQELECESLHMDYKLLGSRRDVEELKSAGFAVFVYTVNDPKQINALLEMGVDAVISDSGGDFIQRNEK